MTNTHRAVFLDHPSLDLGDLDLSPLQECFSDLQLFAQTTPDQVIERLKGATVAISNKILIDAAATGTSTVWGAGYRYDPNLAQLRTFAMRTTNG